MNLRKNWSKLLGLLLIVVIIYWGINNLTSIKTGFSFIVSAFVPFLIGGAIAFILNIPLKLFEKMLVKLSGEYKRWFRYVAIALSFLIVVLFLYLLFFLIIPDLQQTITSFINVVPNSIRTFVEWTQKFIENNPRIVDFVSQLDLDFNRIQQNIIRTVQQFSGNLVGSTIDLILSTIDSVVTIFIAIVFSVYIMSMKESLIRQLKKLLYSSFSLRWANYFVNVGKKANEIFSSFVGGQILEALILGVLVYIGMWIFNFPYRLSVSAITGALALIPIYGAILGGMVGFVLISVVNFTQALGFILFIIIVQQIEGNVIYPRVVGSSVGLPGIWVMMVVTVGGSFFGLVGMLVAVPVVSLFYAIGSANVNYRLEQRNLNIDTETSNLTK